MSMFNQIANHISPANPMSAKKRALIERGIEAMEKAVEEEKKIQEPERKVEQPEPAPAEKTQAVRPLIYLTFPVYGYENSSPVWFSSLEATLRKMGYLTYCPNKPVAAQYQQSDLSSLSMLSAKIVQAMCPMLKLPEEILFPFEGILSHIEKSDLGFDNAASVFTSLWFLARASVVIADLERPMVGAETAGELVYAKLLSLPTIGLLPGSGALSPWAQHLSTILFTDRMLANVLPIIQGYAPLAS